MPQLNATGSSYASVAMSEWEGLFNEQDGGNVNFTVSSSIVGLNDFCNRTVSFALSDLSYAAGLSDCSPSQVPYPYQYIPDVGGSLAFEYNLQGPNGKRITDLVLNAPTLLGIFTGSINNWDNAAIQALNPGTPMPDEAITAFYRTRPFRGELPPVVLLLVISTRAPSPPSSRWRMSPPRRARRRRRGLTSPTAIPPNLDSLIGVNGGRGLAGTVAARRILDVETAYSKNVRLPWPLLVNEAGDAVQPTAENGIEALQGATLNADLSENLTGVFDDTAAEAIRCPLRLFCRPLQPILRSSRQTDDVLRRQTAASRPSPLPKVPSWDSSSTSPCAPVRPMSPNSATRPCLSNWSRMPLPGHRPDRRATEPPPPTATNCPNPTITGETDTISAAAPLFRRLPSDAPRCQSPRSSPSSATPGSGGPSVEFIDPRLFGHRRWRR